MSANYLPNLNTYTDLKPFRFWCQKVLPLAYDDSLSYYELLNKVVDYLNKTMEDVTLSIEDVQKLHTAYEQLETYVNDYFDNLDVQEEINTKLDSLVEDGTIHNIFNPDVEAILSVASQAASDAIEAIPSNVTAWLDTHVTPETEILLDESLTIEGAAADAKAAGDQIRALKSDLNNVKDILDIVDNFTVTETVQGTVVVAPDVTFAVGDTLKWSIPSAINVPVYVYVYDSNDEQLYSRNIPTGQTELSVTMTDPAIHGHITCISSVETPVTFTIIPSITENKIDVIDAELERLGEAIEGISELDIIPGYDLKNANGVETGAGAYYWTGGAPYLNTSGSYGTDYTYFIFPVKKNTVYSVSDTPRWIILVDENGELVSETLTGKMIETGNAVKLYFTIANAFASILAISEGYLANTVVKKKLGAEPDPVNNHGNSLPMDTLYLSVGIPETLYYNNMLALDTDRVQFITQCGGQDAHNANGVTITPNTAFSNPNNAVRIIQYDANLEEIYKPQYLGLVIKALSLRDCSALVIGDSTVGSWGTMTQNMLDRFTEAGHTLTLLGTRGEGLNKHEGRGGWSAKAYCTEASHGDYTNPFLNAGHFDFAYYMTNQGYSAPDFVIIQLGINDVSNTYMPEFPTVSKQALEYEKEMIDSIREYNPNIKILINPPTTPSTDQSVLSMYEQTTIFRNLVIRYAMMLRRLVTQYSSNNVRASNNNLILNGASDFRDAVHPTTEGFNKLGGEMVNQINCWL